MKAAIAMSVILATGCGTIFNGGPATVAPAPGVAINGYQTVQLVDKGMPVQVAYAQGGFCMIGSGISVSYLLLDIFLTGVIGIVIDAITGDWNVLDEGSCPGVMVQN